MEKSFSESYKEAGVDITAGYKAVELMKKHVARTMPDGKTDIGGFGGLFPLGLDGIKDPVLVSGTDGVGTKLRLAQLLDRHDTIGIDCVAMCVNDVLCCGAKPLFFLDYIACGKNIPEKIAEIVGGVAEGCVRAGCALIGGETAEHPGTMPEDDYDLAGFTVGVVSREKVIDKSKMKAGDVMIALPSSGVHSNGFSLVRKVFDVERCDLTAPVAELGGKSLGGEHAPEGGHRGAAGGVTGPHALKGRTRVGKGPRHRPSCRCSFVAPLSQRLQVDGNPGLCRTAPHSSPTILRSARKTVATARGARYRGRGRRGGASGERSCHGHYF